MKLIIGDRATFMASGKNIPVADIALEAAKEWIRQNMRFIDPERNLQYGFVLGQGSEELVDIFQRPGEVRGANDTSAVVGYYPLSPTEKVILEFERYLNSKKFKDEYPETGEDIKVMGLRRVNVLELTVAMPLLASYIRSEKEYFERKERIHQEMTRFLEKFEGFKTIGTHFKSLDEKGRELGGIYLTLLGTSAEDADSGQVGRGNRVNGLISVNRPMGTEAAAGKNPVSHVGKIYNVLAHQIAKQIYQKIEGIKEVYVILLSRIGAPIDKPWMVTAQVILEKGRKIHEISGPINDIFEDRLADINRFSRDLSVGKYPIC
jgi:S-adenosylmethionine synthetase